MEFLTALIFKGLFFIFFGCTMEVVFSVVGIERLVGKKIPRRVPKNYFEGFISLYMFPIYFFLLPLCFQPTFEFIREWPIIGRYVFWCIGITSCEAILGFILDKTIGLYPWDYYKLSPYKVFREGYTLWNLLPFWGLAGLALEFYSDFLNLIYPVFVKFIE